jgi:lysyl-tRNA synthetase class 2
MHDRNEPEQRDQAPEEGMLETYRSQRIRKMDRLRAQGIDPFPAGPFAKEMIAEGLARPVGHPARVAGRIMLLRRMGHITFFQLRDESGVMQIVLSRKEFEARKSHAGDRRQEYKFWTEHLDIGDFVGVAGERMDTRTGERSVKVHELTLLAKAIRPLPDKRKGLRDEDSRLRKRYLSIIFDRGEQEIVYKKSRYWNSVRQFLLARGFVEVQTPALEVTTGGADARPFRTYHNALGIDVYLRISQGELWQKRLMVAGFEKTFEIGRQFRNEGISREHANDYDQMEFYWAYADAGQGMRLVEELFRFMAKETFGTLQFHLGWEDRKYDIDLARPWLRYDYVETVKQLTGIDILTASLGAISAKLAELGEMSHGQGLTQPRAIDKLWKHCRKQLSGPAFLVNEPVIISPLAKRKADNPALVDRFHVIIAGSELGNGYSELNDPIDQARRFAAQQRMRETGDEEAQMSDHDFIEALEYGMPPTCGFGMSERVFAFFMNKSIRECQIFPLMKPNSAE